MNLKEFICTIKRVATQGSVIRDRGKAADGIGIQSGLIISDRIKWQPRWKIEKYADNEAYKAGIPAEVLEIPGNLLLNEGITEMLNLAI